MSSLNKIVLIGNLTAEPEQRTTNSGDSFSRFTLAIDRPTGPEGMSSTTDFLPVVAWRELAQQTQGFQNGDRVLVEGRIVTRTYDDEEGKRHYITEVEARLLQSLSGALSVPREAAPSTAHVSTPRASMSVPGSAAFSPIASVPFSSPAPAPQVAPVQELPVLEAKPVQSFSDDEFDFGKGLPESFTEEIEEDIPF